MYQYRSCFPYSMVSRQRDLHIMKNCPDFFRYWQLVVTKTIRYWRSVKFLSIAPLPLHFSWTYSYVYGYYRSMSRLYKLGIILWLHFNGIRRLLFDSLYSFHLVLELSVHASAYFVYYILDFTVIKFNSEGWNHERKLFKDITSS